MRFVVNTYSSCESYRAAGNKENGKKIIKPYEKPVYRDNCNHDLSILQIVIDL